MLIKLLAPWLLVDLRNSGRVNIQLKLQANCTASAVWNLMKDWKLWMCHDPFHCEVRSNSLPLKAGTKFELLHGLCGFGFWRRGRILEVREDEGFSFSDLSVDNPIKGFPHIYRYEIIACDDHSSMLELSVRGRWTARGLPKSIVMTWLVFTSALISAFLLFQLYRQVLKEVVKPNRKWTFFT